MVVDSRIIEVASCFNHVMSTRVVGEHLTEHIIIRYATLHVESDMYVMVFRHIIVWNYFCSAPTSEQPKYSTFATLLSWRIPWASFARVCDLTPSDFPNSEPD